MEKERDQIEIILLPVDIAEADKTVQPGSTVITADCGHECYIAPSSLQTMKNPDNDYSTICGRCMDPMKVVEELKLTPEGVQELINTYTPEQVLTMLELAKSAQLRKAWTQQLKER